MRILRPIEFEMVISYLLFVWVQETPVLKPNPWVRLSLCLPHAHPYADSAQASFANDPKPLVERGKKVCDLLFGSPQFDFHVGLGFPDADSKSNDSALSDLFSSKLKESLGTSYTFETVIDLLLETEGGNMASVTRPKLKQSIACLDQIIQNLPSSETRKRLLCKECKYLLLGAVHPAESAKQLADLSRKAAYISPSVSQVALAHAINLYRLASMEQSAVRSFQDGRSLFGGFNPTTYGQGFWSGRKVSVTTLTSEGGKVSQSTTQEIVEPHLPWKF